jgi:hypothetical protein
MARIAFLLLALFAEMERTFTAEPPPTPARSLNPRAATSADPPPDPTTRSTTPDCFVNRETAWRNHEQDRHEAGAANRHARTDRLAVRFDTRDHTGIDEVAFRDDSVAGRWT